MSPLHSLLHMDRVNATGSVITGVFYAPKALASVGWLSEIDAVLVTLTALMGLISITFLAMYNAWRWFNRREIRQQEMAEERRVANQTPPDASQPSFSQTKGYESTRRDKPKDYDI